MDTNAILAQFSAIDTVLHLHYASSITTPKVGDICAKASTMCGKRVTSASLELILHYFPEAYKIVSYGPHAYDYYITVPPKVAILKFGTQLPSRKLKFERLLENADLANKRGDAPTLASVAVLESSLVAAVGLGLPISSRFSSPNTSPVKKLPRGSPTKITKASLLRNDRSKFLFKEKISAVESSNAKGLSLLERIKLKEKNLHNLETPESKYHAQINGKLSAVYEVIYELALSLEANAPKIRSFLLHKVASIVQDSFSSRIAETEVLDAINELESRLGPDKIHVIARGGVQALKVAQLDRNSDLSLISN